jgi:hypothetical protein
MLNLPTMRLAGLTFALALFAPLTAHADALDPQQDPEVQRVMKGRVTVKWNYVPAGQSERYGHAETITETTPEKARDAMVDFAHFKDLNKKFANARVVAKNGDDTDLYVKIPVKVGFVSVDQSAVLRFGPAKQVGNAWVVEGKSVSGNMKAGHVKFTVRPIDEKRSLIKVDVMLEPSMPAPQSVVDEEARDAALELADGLKDKSQGWVGMTTF